MKFTLASILSAAAAALSFTSCASTSGSTTGAKSYPLTTCIVTDNDLGSMGGELSLVHNGQTVKFCCQPCVGKFQKNPAKYLAKITQ